MIEAQADSEREEVQRPVYVLGAGFTRAFLEAAPLLIDDFDTERLAADFRPFERASQILASERALTDGVRIDIERLMTRLTGGMPYDSSRGSDAELGLLLSRLTDAFRDRLKAARLGKRADAELNAFAAHVVNGRIDCVTFNYDDVLDEALYRVRGSEVATTDPYWHPDGGYGFFCRRSESCVQSVDYFMDNTSMRLLKLHGSLNWRPLRGSVQPYAVADMIHFEDWRKPQRVRLIEQGVPEAEVNALIERHLESQPFIVPPVLMKSDLTTQPLLKLIWSVAYDTLNKATEVVFVGYSLPPTDLASSYMFHEALAALPTERITIIGSADSKRKADLIRSYRRIFPRLAEANFRWEGALAWTRRIVAGDAKQETLPLEPPNK